MYVLPDWLFIGAYREKMQKNYHHPWNDAIITLFKCELTGQIKQLT